MKPERGHFYKTANDFDAFIIATTCPFPERKRNMIMGWVRGNYEGIGFVHQCIWDDDGKCPNQAYDLVRDLGKYALREPPTAHYVKDLFGNPVGPSEQPSY